MTLIELSPKHTGLLEALAQQQQTSIQTIVEDLIERFLREQRHASLLEEMERFRQLHPELLARYRGQYVAMVGGQVVDSDLDGGELYMRVVRRYGDQPVLIVEVTEQPEQEFRRLSRRLVP
ncbi:MAG: DUF5678 domain-containing protein [Caldilineales bacterium]|nr:DUF5678 domain-containing protein [Caldilineales bacterium]MDW8316603.1 DUF5678 domain-containing protein [Anaerolineae bacterium]